MITMIAIGAAVLALLGMLLFNGGILFCLIALVLAAAAIVLPRIGAPKARSVFRVLSVVFSFAACILLCVGPVRTGSSVYDYRNELQKIAQEEKTSPEKALELLDALAESDGWENNSAAAAIRTKAYLDLNDYENARNAIYGIGYTDKEYYILMAEILKKTNSESRELLNLYREAVEYCPDWDDGYAFAGAYIHDLDQNNLRAKYYLEGALALNENNIAANYYMGVVCFEEAAYENALICFDRCIRNGAPEAYVKSIAVYLFRMGANET